MSNYFLFIDTETSGLPQKWDAPYSHQSNWPFALQVSWIIYSRDGRAVKQEDHFIADPSVTIEVSAQKIHGLTTEFLNIHGKDRAVVLQKLSHDLETYQPVVIGHFMKLDYHVLGAEYFRSGLQNRLQALPCFCTMQATPHLSANPARKYLRLSELYEQLFHSCIDQYHNALADVKATAACFFELWKRGEISEESIELQQKKVDLKMPAAMESSYFVPVSIWGVFILFIVYFLWKNHSGF